MPSNTDHAVSYPKEPTKEEMISAAKPGESWAEVRERLMFPDETQVPTQSWLSRRSEEARRIAEDARMDDELDDLQMFGPQYPNASSPSRHKPLTEEQVREMPCYQSLMKIGSDWVAYRDRSPREDTGGVFRYFVHTKYSDGWLINCRFIDWRWTCDDGGCIPHRDVIYWRLAGINETECREATVEELSALPWRKR